MRPCVATCLLISVLFGGVTAPAAFGAGKKPYLVKDIRPGAANGSPIDFTLIGNRVFFSANDGVNGREIWVTDGTAEGTHLVKDTFPGPGVPTTPYPRALTAVGDRLFFQRDDGVHGAELWVSDGSPQGTYMVKDINPTGDSDPSDRLGHDEPMMAWNGRAVFSADNDVNGRELWTSDGTLAGTVMLQDLRPGTPDGDPEFLTDVGAYFLFSANATGVGRELWRSDGTTATTVLLRDIWPGGNSSPFLLVNVNGTVFFKAYDAPSNDELWKSDGTVAGTVKVKEIHPTNGSEPRSLTNVNGTLFFTAYDADDDLELWKSDGTEAGTIRVADINPNGWSSPKLSERGVLNGRLFFEANDGIHGLEVWVTDGMEDGTYLVKDINPNGNFSPYGYLLTAANGAVYFMADDGVHGLELWKTDGTEEGTIMVADINPGPGNGEPGLFIQLGDLLLFSAIDGVHGYELWALDIGEPDIPAASFAGLLVMILTLLGAGTVLLRVRRKTSLFMDEHGKDGQHVS